MPRITEIQTDKTLYPIESEILGHLPEFESGTKRALVTGVEAAAIALKVSTGIHNFAAHSPYFYLKWMGKDEERQLWEYQDHMITQGRASANNLAEVA